MYTTPLHGTHRTIPTYIYYHSSLHRTRYKRYDVALLYIYMHLVHSTSFYVRVHTSTFVHSTRCIVQGRATTRYTCVRCTSYEVCSIQVCSSRQLSRMNIATLQLRHICPRKKEGGTQNALRNRLLHSARLAGTSRTPSGPLQVCWDRRIWRRRQLSPT